MRVGPWIARHLLAGAAVLALCAVAHAQVTIAASVGPAGSPANGASTARAVSLEGRHVLFTSTASNLAATDADPLLDVFRRDTWLHQTVQMNLREDGHTPLRPCLEPQLTADGAALLFVSPEPDLADSDENGGGTDVFVRDVATGTIEHVSVGSEGWGAAAPCESASASPDGRFVVFQTVAGNLVENDTNQTYDVFLRDRLLQTTERVSVASGGAQLLGGGGFGAVSDDGNVVAFITSAREFDSDAAPVYGVALRDRARDTTTFLSLDPQGHPFGVLALRLCGDGSRVAFLTAAQLDPADVSAFTLDVYVQDASGGPFHWASRGAPGGPYGPPPCSAHLASMSRDGSRVAFDTTAGLAPDDQNGAADVYVYDLFEDHAAPVSVGPAGAAAGGEGGFLDASGTTVAFTSAASNLVPGDRNGAPDAFARRSCAAATSTPYGVGTGDPGTLPGVVLLFSPQLGKPNLLALGTADGHPAPGALVLGWAPPEPDAPALSGGEGSAGPLLVQPALVVPVVVPAGGLVIPFTLPAQTTWCGTHVFLQLVLADANAPGGVSFGAGLDVRLGL